MQKITSNFELKWAREHAGLTQAEAGEAMGVSRETFNGWESGRAPIPALKFTKFLQGVNLTLADIPEPLEGSALPAEEAPLPPPPAPTHPEGLSLSDPYWFTPVEGEHWMAAHERKVARTKLAFGFTEQLQDFVKYTVKPTGLYPALWATGFINSKDAKGNFDPELALEKCEKWFEENKATAPLA